MEGENAVVICAKGAAGTIIGLVRIPTISSVPVVKQLWTEIPGISPKVLNPLAAGELPIERLALR